MIRKFTSKKLIEVWGDGKDLKAFYIQDFCDALVKIIKIQKSEILNIASGKSITIKEIIHLLFYILKGKTEKFFMINQNHQ